MSMVIEFAMVELNGPFSEQFPLDGPYMVVKEIDDFPLAMATWPLGDACWSDCISH